MWRVKTRSLVNNTGLAGNLQFYGISPSNPTVTQIVSISPSDNFAATVYAPGANWLSTATWTSSVRLWSRASMPTATPAGIMIEP
jgi:hypothetical protein